MSKEFIVLVVSTSAQFIDNQDLLVWLYTCQGHFSYCFNNKLQPSKFNKCPVSFVTVFIDVLVSYL